MEKNKVIQLTKNSSYRELYYSHNQLWYKAFLIGKERYGYYEYHYVRLEPIKKVYYAR
jgi:hypothetical protein